MNSHVNMTIHQVKPEYFGYVRLNYSTVCSVCVSFIQRYSTTFRCIVSLQEVLNLATCGFIKVKTINSFLTEYKSAFNLRFPKLSTNYSKNVEITEYQIMNIVENLARVLKSVQKSP